jgi:hypothetical protein
MEIFYPVMLLIFHTLLVASFMAYQRYTAVMRREVDPDYYTVYQGEEPANLRKVSRHVINLLEFPPVFYVGAIIAYVTGQTGSLLLALAWAYVGLRLVHTFIHLGKNVVIVRFKVFILSAVVLAVFLGVITAGLFRGGTPLA